MRVRAIDNAHAVGIADHLVGCIWRTVTTYEAVAELGEIVRGHARTHAPLILLTVVEADAVLPAASARNELAEILREVGDAVVCSGLVFEGEGIRAATVRGVVTGISMLARQPFPHTSFATIAEAAAWLEEHDSRMAASRIVAELEELRAALGGQSTAPVG